MLHDDEDDFFPTNNSNLAAVFNSNLLEGNNTSLTYVAPKQPKRHNPDDIKRGGEQNVKTAVIYAKPITLYKIIGSSYNQVGKYGMALIGNENLSIYELIVYKDKQNVLVRIKLMANFNVLLQDEVHVTLKDHDNQFWSFKFENEGDLSGFISELKKKKFKITKNSKLNTKPTLTPAKQDVIISNLDNATISDKEANVMAKVNKEVVQAYVNKTEEPTESDSKTKADILSRIVKMGQKTLPTVRNDSVDTESSTSEVSATEEVTSNDIKEVIPQNGKKVNNYVKLRTQDSVNMSDQISPTANTFYPNDLLPSHYMHLLTAQQNNQSAEIRMQLTQLSGKIDSILIDSHRFKYKEEDLIQEKIAKLEARLAAYEFSPNAKCNNDEESKTKVIGEQFQKIENKMETLITCNAKLRNDIEQLQDEFRKKEFAKMQEIIKEFMNDMYISMCLNFVKESYTGEEIRKEIGKSIKSETLKLVTKLQTNMFN